METTDSEDADKFQSTTDMLSKVLVKCVEFFGALEDENREVLLVLMVQLLFNDG
jgi:hypothetical protein